MPIDLAESMNGNERDAEKAIKSVLDHFGRLDILVNLANSRLFVEDVCEATTLANRDLQFCCNSQNCITNYHKIMNSQVNAIVYLCLASFQALSASQGSIVNITTTTTTAPITMQNGCFNQTSKCSTSAKTQLNQGNSISNSDLINERQFTFGSCMAKAALTTFSKCLAHDFAPHVRVNCISLGPIANGIIDDMGLKTTTQNSNTGDENNNNNNNNFATKRVEIKNKQANDCELTELEAGHKEDFVAKLKLQETNPKKVHGNVQTNSMLFSSKRQAAQSNELAKMIIYLSSRERGAYITGSRVLLAGTSPNLN